MQLVNDSGYANLVLGSFTDAATYSLSAGGATFSWYVTGIKSGAVYNSIIDYGTNVTADTMTINAGVSSAVLNLTGKVVHTPWYGDEFGTGTFTLDIAAPVSAIPEPDVSPMLAIGLCAVALVQRVAKWGK